MYLPSHFAETRTEILHKTIGEYPFATLVTLGSGGLEANSIPLELDPETGPLGTLRGHVSRANPVWQDFRTDIESLAIFHGPQFYVSPGWLASKKEHGRVVPTWNYITVHAHGELRFIDDVAWLEGLVSRLTNRFEAGRREPWQVSDAPAPYIAGALRGIIGVELRITKLNGKWKLSQNRSLEDRAGIAEGLRDEGTPDLAALIR